MNIRRPLRFPTFRRVIVALAAVPLVATLGLAVPAHALPAPRAAACTVSALLVPSCGAWWGMTPAGTVPQAQGLAEFDRLTGARSDIFHTYKNFGDLFPTPRELAIARDPAGKRLLMFNLWPITGGRTWAQIAAGAQDIYLTQLAAYIETTFPEKFFMTIHHEPEDDVDATPGSGMTATDYAAMFRHVVTTLKSHGLSNAVFVMNYMGVPNYTLESWWPTLYPGDDVVDWVGFDAYSCFEPEPGVPCTDFSEMMNRRYRLSSPWLGMYNWATTHHPDKPIMIPEIGVFNGGGMRKANALRSIGQQVSEFPAVKAIMYWNAGTVRPCTITSGKGTVAAAAATAQNPWFDQSVP